MGNNQSKKEEVKVVVLDQNSNSTVQDVKTVQVVETRPVTQANVQRVEVVERPVSFKHYIECATDSLLGVGPWIHRKKLEYRQSQFVNAIRDAQNNLNTQVKEPLCRLYNTIPEKFTEAKFQLIDPYTYNQRFAALNILCALTAIGTISSTSKINPLSRVLRTTRNVAFMYVFAGLVIAPEIYNPFIKG